MFATSRQRWLNLKKYWFLVRTFRNGVSLTFQHRRKSPSDRAVLWGGTVLRHPPGRRGLVDALWETWYRPAYTDGFYDAKRGDVVIDAGANVGLFTLWVARRHPGVRVTAFEPSDENVAVLRQNVAAAGLTNVEVIQAGLGAESGYGKIERTTDRSLDDRLVAAPPSSDGAVPVLALSGMLRAANADRVALLKVDIEGAEHDLFSTATSGDLGRIDRIALEYHDHIRPGTLALLRERLAATHELTVRPERDARVGILRAVRR